MLSPDKDGSAPVCEHTLGPATYERHRPESLLSQLIEKHYPTLVGQLEAQDKSLPTHDHQAFEAHLKSGRPLVDAGCVFPHPAAVKTQTSSPESFITLPILERCLHQFPEVAPGSKL
jgi:hypothetical protein